MDIGTLFSTANYSAFRLEGLPAYIVASEAESLSQFEIDGSVPLEHNLDWALTVSSCLDRGCKVSRLRLVSEPASKYEEFELSAAYNAGLRAGEDIRIIPRRQVHLPLYDFWTFDDKWIAEMSYSAGGEFIGVAIREMTTADLEMSRYWLARFEKAEKIA